MTVGELLRKARKNLRKRQLDIAIETGVKQPTVSAWEADECLPERNRFPQVATAYGISPLDLLPKGE